MGMWYAWLCSMPSTYTRFSIWDQGVLVMKAHRWTLGTWISTSNKNERKEGHRRHRRVRKGDREGAYMNTRRHEYMLHGRGQGMEDRAKRDTHQNRNMKERERETAERWWARRCG